MSAVDQAGRQAARYRIADRHTIEITAHPDQHPTDEPTLTLALTARRIHWAVHTESAGGA